jgi:hypothetical protein
VDAPHAGAHEGCDLEQLRADRRDRGMSELGMAQGLAWDRRGLPLRAWRIKRLAGLPPKIAPAIETALAEAAGGNSSIRERSTTCR